jgi:hypothetical protein
MWLLLKCNYQEGYNRDNVWIRVWIKNMSKLSSFDLRSLLTTEQLEAIQDRDDRWIQDAIAKKLTHEAWLKENSAEAKAIRRIAEPIADSDWIELPEPTDEEIKAGIVTLRSRGYNVEILG